MIIKEYRNKFNPKYEYFAHYNIRLNDYDEEVANNLVDIIKGNWNYLQVLDLGPNKGIDFIIHIEDNPKWISIDYIYETLDYYDDEYTSNITITTLPMPNIYADDKYYVIDTGELLSTEIVEEMWANSFVGYGDYDEKYPTTFNAFVRQCVEGGEMLLVKWMEG